MMWNGTRYLFVNDGNGLRISSLANPAMPAFKSRKTMSCSNGCWTGLDGDNDWQLLQFSICDECRHGFADFGVKGRAVFELGSAADPAIQGAHGFWQPESPYVGGMVFRHAGSEYLIAQGITPACSSGAATLMKINSSSDLTNLQCLEGANGVPVFISGGLFVPGADADYIYLGDNQSRLHIYRVTGSGTSTQMTWLGASMNGIFGYGGGPSLDLAQDLMVTVIGSGVGTPNIRIYDISDPSLPVILHQMQVTGAYYNRGEIQYPFLWIGSQAHLNTRTYDIANPTDPVALDQDFWDPSNTWNARVKTQDYDAEFSLDATQMYIARFSITQQISYANCGAGAPPTANLTVSQNPAFPGDTITITNVSAGMVEEAALWVTNELGDVVAGSDTLAAGTTTLSFQVPIDVPYAERYTAHVAAQNDDNPYNPNLPGNQHKAVVIQLNRQPEVQIGITPDAAITGQTVTLEAIAEGHPSDPSGGNAYSWTVTPPMAEAYTAVGAQLQVPIENSGDWRFDSTVLYEHPSATGAGYRASASRTETYTSVAANFSYTSASSPNDPCADESITLQSTSVSSSGASLAYAWQVSGPSTYHGCSNSNNCTIPANSLQPGNYTVTLTLTNNAVSPPDQSIISKQVRVRDCSVNLAFSMSTTSPDIGQSILFQIFGVSGEIDQARWNFGGPGCSGYSQVYTCTPGPTWNCLTDTFKYSSAGAKNVTLTVVIDGDSYTATSQSLTVQSSGSCGGTSTCTYDVNPSSTTIGYQGGTGSFAVQTSSTSCSWNASVVGGSWITITNGTSGTGGTTLRYSVSQNSGAQRTGQISVQGKSYSIIQSANPNVSLDFSISKTSPAIGERITLQALNGAVVTGWDMGGSNCDGDSPSISCSIFHCETTAWSFSSAGTKTIRMYTANGSVTKNVTVTSSGQCPNDCQASAKPNASFTISTNPAVVGEAVTFIDTSSEKAWRFATPKIKSPAGSAKIQSAGFSWSPTNPDIGAMVGFTLTGVSDIAEVTWNFGEPGCSDNPQIVTCTPGYSWDCTMQAHRFASAGDKTVSVTIRRSNNSTINVPAKTVTVNSSGSCPGGGGTTCSYSVSPTSKTFTAAGGSGTFSVSCGSGCAWSATKNRSWISLNGSASGSGNGSVSYQVAANTGAARSGAIQAGGRTFSVSQSAGSSGGTGGNDPESLLWRIRKDGSTVAQSSAPSFAHTFTQPGQYTVTLEATNCKGTDVATQDLVVVEYVDPDNQVVPAAAHTPGDNDTLWLSDVRLFNPGNETTQIMLEFLPEGQPSAVTPGINVTLAPHQTRVFRDVLTRIPLVGGGEIQGGLLFRYEQGDGTFPAIVSRTYNETPIGTFGQFVPAVPMKEGKTADVIYLTGLVHNQSFRTNLGFANPNATKLVGIEVAILDPSGEQIGNTYSFNIEPNATKQLSRIVERCGIRDDVDLFTVRIDTKGNDMVAYASVVDSLTGDPTLYAPAEFGDTALHVLGAAHAPGNNDSEWRTDISFMNPTDEPLEAIVVYVPREASDIQPQLRLTLQPLQSYGLVDIVSTMLLGSTGDGSQGYLEITGVDGGPAPIVAARTYNLAQEGSFGQGLIGFGSQTCIQEGTKAFLPGLVGSEDAETGFRSNVGFANLGDQAASLLAMLYDESGTMIASRRYNLAAREYKQSNVFTDMGLGNQDIEGSLIIEVEHGGPVAGYVSVIDGNTNDPMFIPLQVAP